MPFKSRRQAKFMFAKKPDMAKEWAAATPDMKKLPQRVGKNGSKTKR
jgi:hypothetical protein